MVFILAGLAFLVVAFFWWRRSSPSTQKAVMRWLPWIFIAAIILLFLLRGAPYGAAIIGGIGAIYVIIQRILQAVSIARTARDFLKKKNSPQEQHIDIEEAYAILGLAQGATEADIIAAYKNLIKKNHPDHGGSAYLAARITAAKTLLLQHIKRSDTP